MKGLYIEFGPLNIRETFRKEKLKISDLYTFLIVMRECKMPKDSSDDLFLFLD
jgi:hypothetical protein